MVTPGAASARGAALLREIIEHTGEVAYRFRLWPTQGFEYVSDSVIELLGYTPDDLYNDPTLPERVVYPDDRELMHEVLQTPGGHQVEVVLRWVHRDGRVVSTELRYVITFDASGRPLHFDGVARDVTQREANRQRLQLIHWRSTLREARAGTATARVLVADDHQLTRAGLRVLLAEDPGLELVAEAEDGLQAVRLAQSLQPDLALLDLRMPRLDGLEATRRLKQVSPMTSVLILSMFEDAQVLVEAVKAGAAGYVLKGANETTLRTAIWEVLAGDLAVDQRLARDVLRRLAQERTPPAPAEAGDLLSAREHEVLRLLARGLTNREIAEQLIIAASTVKIHVEHILAKLGVSDRTQAAVRAIELGYIARDASR
ncbi:MAG: response regulator [Chloroflexi bacterium]|nr:response regulator [Chloroflexota bacterium]MBV9595971.1 response regulator [Chloroflexota bacterium]